VPTKPTTKDDTAIAEAAAVESELAKELVASGAAPVSVDIEALVRQIQELQEVQTKLMAERGIPADPTAAHMQALKDHLTVQSKANPVHAESYAKVLSYVDGLDSKSLASNQTEKVVRLVDKIQRTHPQHELAYVRDLANELHIMTLDPEED